MGTISEKLTYLNNTKSAIKEAIVSKGGSVEETDTFRSYADKIENLEGGGETEETLAELLEGTIVNLVIPEQVTELRSYICVDCSLLETVDLNNVTKINKYAFNNCISLGELDLKQAAYIDSYAFYGCSGLTKIWLPKTCLTLEGSTVFLAPFYGAKNLVIYTDAAEKQEGWDTYWNYVSSSKEAEVVWGAAYQDFIDDTYRNTDTEGE